MSFEYSNFEEDLDINSNRFTDTKENVLFIQS